jgi:hypothetical protein
VRSGKWEVGSGKWEVGRVRRCEEGRGRRDVARNQGCPGRGLCGSWLNSSRRASGGAWGSGAAEKPPCFPIVVG